MLAFYEVWCLECNTAWQATVSYWIHLFDVSIEACCLSIVKLAFHSWSRYFNWDLDIFALVVDVDILGGAGLCCY